MAIIKTLFCALICAFGLAGISPIACAEALFGFSEHPQASLQELPQWQRILDKEAASTCRSPFETSCRSMEWSQFLESVQLLPPEIQIARVNRHFNNKPYTLDRANYGQEDYWASVEEFLQRSGDCEDYAITKYFALRQLGFPPEQLRIVVLQDTNLRIGHAVLAVYRGDDILILDNQTKEVISHQAIHHYVPLFSVNEQSWWLHIPTFPNS